ncbi:hypothetical protein B0H11DRAFT_2240078 [Mycena galericulata]|nr:hypothetical protein B0H11DRAFT_2240078 [Mycena galericulata]
MDLVSLIHKNDAPTEFQVREVHRLLDAGQNELARLEGTIRTISLIISELKFQKSQRIDSLAALRRILCPIRRLPSELLAEIFLFCRTNSMHTKGYSIIDVREAPMLLSHVSARWRAVSVGTPMLWDLPRFTSSISQIWPLHSPPADEDCFQFFTTLRHRLHHLSINLGHKDVVDHVKFSPASTILPVLSSLDIIVDDDGPGQLATIMASFQRAPSLRSLTLNAYFSPVVPTYDFPWSQLTSLNLSIPIDEGIAYQILVQCTQLETCALSEMYDPYNSPSPPPNCTLDVLRSFSFAPWNASLGELLDFFTFPNMESFTLRGCTDMLAPVIFDLHARSRFKLQHLNFCDLQIDTNELVAFLCHLPELQTLALEDSDSLITDDLFRVFTYYPRSQTPFLSLPCLAALAIRHIAIPSPAPSWLT